MTYWAYGVLIILVDFSEFANQLGILLFLFSQWGIMVFLSYQWNFIILWRYPAYYELICFCEIYEY